MRILTLGTYPITEPRHGGQVRVNAIHRMLRQAGHEMRHLAFYRSDQYPEEPHSPWNIAFSWSFINDLIATGRRTDVSASDFLILDGQVRRRVIDMIIGFAPDIVMFEQCWMWPGWKLLVRESPALGRVRVVYSSQNVEHRLLQKSGGPGAAPISDELVNLVRDMEIDLVQAADVVLAVSEADASTFSANTSKVILAPNGIWPRPEATGSDFWRAELGSRRIALFVGSAHPPNAAGFMAMVGPSLGYLALDESVVVVGGVCNLLMRDKIFRRNLGINLARSKLAGVQDSGGLSTLLGMADIVLVPITEGGGTNIKMAEGLYNRKIILCTSKAMRGFENFMDLPSVIVRDTPEEYKAALVDLLRGRSRIEFKNNREQAQRLNGLIWSSVLAPVSSAVATLAR